MRNGTFIILAYLLAGCAVSHIEVSPGAAFCESAVRCRNVLEWPGMTPGLCAAWAGHVGDDVVTAFAECGELSDDECLVAECALQNVGGWEP